LPAKIEAIKNTGDVVQYGDTIAVLIEARSADDDVGLGFSVATDNTTTAPQASTPVIAKIVSTSAQERDAIISIGAGNSSGINLDWEASLLGRNGDERMVNSKIQIVRVDETITVGMIRNVDAQTISANSRVKLSAPRCISPRVLCDGACVDINRNANHCGHCDTKCPSGICSLRSCMSRVELPAPGGGTMLPMVKTGDVVPAGAVVARIQHKAIPTATFKVDDASSLSPKSRVSIRIESTGQSITCTLVKTQINLIKVACPDNAALVEGVLVTYATAR
jgi:pyruvate/2-oxoglutarate dehydrogenase complex dihydrolipoamide acyltransferase (E2) component